VRRLRVRNCWGGRNSELIGRLGIWGTATRGKRVPGGGGSAFHLAFALGMQGGVGGWERLNRRNECLSRHEIMGRLRAGPI